MAWGVRHRNKLKKKPRVVFGPVSRIEKDSNGNFTIPVVPPPTMATSVWQEVVYEYHSDGYEEWSVPVGTVEHEKVKRLTQRYNYESLRAEAELFQEELERERNAVPPEVSERSIDYEIEKGFLLFEKGQKGKGLQRKDSLPVGTTSKSNDSELAIDNAKILTSFYGVKIGVPIYKQESFDHCTIGKILETWCHAEFDGTLLGFCEGAIAWTQRESLVHSIWLHKEYGKSQPMNKVRIFILNELEKMYGGHFVEQKPTEANWAYMGDMYLGRKEGRHQRIRVIVGNSKSKDKPEICIQFTDSVTLDLRRKELKMEKAKTNDKIAERS